jgi:hypothetical protein
MTLLDAQEYDAEKSRKRRKQIISAIAILVTVLGLGWWFRYWPDERIVGHFFKALQKQDYKTAYGIWMHDPQWQEHPDQHPKYLFNDFYRDWGPGGEWGLIKTQKVYGASTCPGGGSGVVVDVIVNDRTEHAQVWVEKSDHTLSYPPCELIFR